MGNQNNTPNNKHRISRSTLWTRILCIILSVLMIGSMAVLAVQFIINSVKEKKEAKASFIIATTTVSKPSSTANVYIYS